MAITDYKGALTVKKINRRVTTPLEMYKPYWCPLNHTEWTETCPSCQTIYGDQRREYGQ